MNNELLSMVRQLDLNLYEAKAYLALAGSTSCTAGELAEKAGLPRPRVYDVLEKLQEKGFVVVQVGRPIKYAALPIGEAVKTIKKKKEITLQNEFKEIEEVGGKLKTLLAGAESITKFDISQNIWTLKGRDSIMSKLETMVSNAKQSVVLASTDEGVAAKVKHCKDALDSAVKRGVAVTIASPSGKSHLIGSKAVAKNLPTRVLLADNEAILFLTDDKSVPHDEEVGLWMQSNHMVNTLKKALE